MFWQKRKFINMRMRRKPNLDLRIEKCSHLLTEQPCAMRGKWLQEHGSDELPYEELHIEIGCGKGLFTVETALNSADVLFAAIEKEQNALVIALERAAQQTVKNIRFVCGFAENLCDYFAPGEVSRIYINFCDPWPANRHIKRRLTNQSYLESYKTILCPGGEIHLKTDSLPLFMYSLSELEKSGFEIIEKTFDLHKDGMVGVLTDYEIKFNEEESVPIYRCTAAAT